MNNNFNLNSLINFLFNLFSMMKLNFELFELYIDEIIDFFIEFVRYNDINLLNFVWIFYQYNLHHMITFKKYNECIIDIKIWIKNIQRIDFKFIKFFHIWENYINIIKIHDNIIIIIFEINIQDFLFWDHHNFLYYQLSFNWLNVYIHWNKWKFITFNLELIFIIIFLLFLLIYYYIF